MSISKCFCYNLTINLLTELPELEKPCRKGILIESI